MDGGRVLPCAVEPGGRVTDSCGEYEFAVAPIAVFRQSGVANTSELAARDVAAQVIDASARVDYTRALPA